MTTTKKWTHLLILILLFLNIVSVRFPISFIQINSKMQMQSFLVFQTSSQQSKCHVLYGFRLSIIDTTVKLVRNLGSLVPLHTYWIGILKRCPSKHFHLSSFEALSFPSRLDGYVCFSLEGNSDFPLILTIWKPSYYVSLNK